MRRLSLAAVLFIVTVGIVAALPVSSVRLTYKTITLDRSYNHDKHLTRPADIVREFRAYVTSFDGPDDNDGNGAGDIWGIPEWVAFHIKAHPGLPGGPSRPTWFTDTHLHAQGLAPKKETYHFSIPWRAANPTSPQLGYDRGHMCRKYTAFRHGADADHNTFTFLNACPQKSDFNQGIWGDLENKIAAWADANGEVWVVTGPIIYGGIVKQWLGQAGEMKVAIPDAFFKIVIKESGTADRPDVLAFIYPQEHPGYSLAGPHNHVSFLKSRDDIEAATGLDFLTILPDADEATVEAATATALW